MQQTIFIQNLKCGGCANTITGELSKLSGISDVIVNKDEASVSFSSDSEDISVLINRLNELGYPPEDDQNSLLKRAKSYVSCAVGRMN